METISSTLTILDAVRKAVKLAKRYYNAAQELVELQVEVDTFASVLNGIVPATFELWRSTAHIAAGIADAQDCLLEIQKLVVFELTKEVPEGKKVRRAAWLRKVEKVHALQERLSECRANVILALDCETASVPLLPVIHEEANPTSSMSVHRSERAVYELQSAFRQKSADIEQSLRQYGDDHRISQALLIEKLECYEQRWESYQRPLLEAQKRQYERMESLLEGLRPERLPAPHQHAQLEWSSNTAEFTVNDCSKVERSSHSAQQTADCCSTTPELGRLVGSERNCELLKKMATSWHHFCSCLSQQDTKRTAAALPTRLIYFGDSVDDIRLHETIEGDVGRYVALSYTWGGTAPIVTTKSSLGARKANIPWAVIPALFQDAILASRTLGIRFVWIDALCILQDDVVDWEREAGRMATVYGNAYLTIAAASSSSATVSLLSNSVVQNFLHAGDESSIIKHEVNPSLRLESRMRTSARTPLRSRAWALQEILLSGRTINFDSGHISFDCRHCSSKAPNNGDLGAQLYRGLEVDPLVASADPGQAWSVLVEEYTRRDMTFESDKLIAISGLAEVIAKRSKQTYWVGLWKETLHANLVWSVRSTGERPPTPTAPSWSWASVIGAITMRSEPLTATSAKLLRCEITPLGENPYGAVHSASLTLKGHCVEAEIEGIERGGVEPGHADEGGQQLLHLRCGNRHVAMQSDVLEEFEIGRVVLCLEVGQGGDGDVYALALRAASESAWSRVGILELLRRRGEHRLFEDAKEREVILV